MNKDQLPEYDGREQGVDEDLEVSSPATEASKARQARDKHTRRNLIVELKGEPTAQHNQAALDAVARQANLAGSPIPEQEYTPTAFLYLRVSTKEQARMGGGDEGYSIPSQRAAGYDKAAQLGAMVAGEYIDAGESAKTAHRPDLQRMLADIKRLRPDYVIVHKIDRLARNREDDIAINLLLRKHGVKLVSCSENIDDTPSGKLLYGLMAEIAQFYSRNLAQEVMKGLVRKAEEGGTPYRPPLGYLNRRETRGGIEYAWVELDPERAEIVGWCFLEYATGEWTVADLTLAAQRKGLTSRPTAKKPAKPVSLTTMHGLLQNPYYMGLVGYQGIYYEGKHPRLVDPEIWLAVQDTLASHNHTGEKDRKHPHYLRGTIYCSDCGARLVYSQNTGNGGTYEYYLCVKKKTKQNNCRRPAVRLERIEEGISDFYACFQVSEQRIEQIRAAVVAEMASQQAAADQHIRRATRRRADLEDQRHKLLQAHYANAIPHAVLASEMERLTRALAEAEVEIRTATASLTSVQATLKAALHAAGNCQAEYDAGPPKIRRQINQGFFKKLFIGTDGSVQRYELTEPFAALLTGGQWLTLE